MTLLEELAKLLIALEKSRNSSSNSNAKLSTSSIVSKVLQLYHNHQTTSDHTVKTFFFLCLLLFFTLYVLYILDQIKIFLTYFLFCFLMASAELSISVLDNLKELDI